MLWVEFLIPQKLDFIFGSANLILTKHYFDFSWLSLSFSRHWYY